MIRNLLALLLALQKTPVNARHECSQLANKLQALSEKKRPPEQDWQSIQTQIDTLLNHDSILAQSYQAICTQLRTWTNDELCAWLPSFEKIKLLLPQHPPTLGYPPASPPSSQDEVTNTIMVISQLILRHDNPAEKSREVLSQWDQTGSHSKAVNQSK